MHHQILSRRNVESLTYLQEEDSYPGYERNEDNAFTGAIMPQLNQSLLNTRKHRRNKR